MFDDLRRLVVGGDENVGERFVVAEENVVARPQPLDEIGLQQKRLGLRAGDNDLQLRGCLDHPHCPARLAVEPGV